MGTGFNNINDGGQYQGSTNDTLVISNLTTVNNAQRFRCVVASGSCSDISSVAILTLNTNTDNGGGNLLTIGPNPTKNMINLKANPVLIGKAFKLCDEVGKTVMTGKITDSEMKISLGKLANATYIFTVEGYKSLSFKIFKN